MKMSAKKLLVADDSLTIQKVIRLALSNEGYEIQAVSDGKDVIEQIALFRPDAVLIDVSLPGKSAFEVKQEFNEGTDFNDAKFILMSSAFEDVDESRVSETGFDGRLVKPFDPAHLRKVLSEALGESEKAAAPATPPPVPEPEPEPAPEPAPEETATPEAEEAVAPPSDEPTLALEPKEESSEGIQAEPEVAMPEDPEGSLDENGGVAEVPPARPGTGLSFAELEDEDSTLIVEPPPPQDDVTASPREDLSDDLWGPEADGDSGSAERDSEPSEDEDIKELTESTIRMSGLDDYQWTVNENATLKKEEEPEEHPSFEPTGEPTEDEDTTVTELRSSEPTLPPLPNMLDKGDSNFPTDVEEYSTAGSHDDDTGITEMPGFDDAPSGDPSRYYYGAHEDDSLSGAEAAEYREAPAGGGSGLSEDEMEEMISREVTRRVEEMARKILPEVAEKVIREEIDRLLSNPPN